MLLKRYPIQSDKAQISMYIHFETRSKVAVGIAGQLYQLKESALPSVFAGALSLKTLEWLPL